MIKTSLHTFPRPQEYIQRLEEKNLNTYAKTYKTLIHFAQNIKKEGGQALLVGGGTRDFFFGKISKDFDIEVYGLPSIIIKEIAEKISSISEVGKSFGILKMTNEEGIDIDISLPRTDSKIHKGHRGFRVNIDPFMSIKIASKRRDFTINTIATDPLTGEVYDPYNGIQDIQNKILRITDKDSFQEDPLRILRAMQFIGRFELEIESKSALIIHNMIHSLQELPKERIFIEWKKLLLQSQKPSIGLEAAKKLGILETLNPEFTALEKTEQSTEWHAEGNVWIHTLMVVDQAAKIVKRENLSENQSMIILMACLCHDLGKPIVTKRINGKITSRGHEEAGEIPTKKFLNSIGIDKMSKKIIISLVLKHLQPILLYTAERKNNKSIKNGAIRRLAQKIYPATLKELILVSEADQRGRGNTEEQKIYNAPSYIFHAGEWLSKRSKNLEIFQNKPKNYITGKEWITFGYTAGPQLGKLITLSNTLRDTKEYSKEDIFQALKLSNTSEKAIETLSHLLMK